MAKEELKLSHVEKIAKYFEELKESDVTNIAKEINRWTDIKVNIGVTGLSGAGKSYFINAIRNLRPLDDGAANVGTTYATMEPTSYPHPQNENLVFWDLPGVGAKEFPRNKYKDVIGFEKYDFFLILSCARFHVDDSWLAKSLKNARKKFHFVRTKLDIDVENAKADFGALEGDTLLTIREGCENKLKEAGLRNTNFKVFLISSLYPKAYDFDSLTSHLIDGASKMQKEVLTLTLFSWSNRELLERKRAMLQDRINMRAVMASAPLVLPYIGSKVRNKVVGDEAVFYRKEFGLDSENLKKVAERMEVPVYAFTLKTKHLSEDVLASSIAVIPIPASVALPLNITKGVAVAVYEYIRVKKFLQESLDKAFSDAFEIHKSYCNRLGRAKL